MKRTTTMTAIAALMVAPTLAFAESHSVSAEMEDTAVQAEQTMEAAEAEVEQEVAEAGQEIDEAADAVNNELAEAGEELEQAGEAAEAEMAELGEEAAEATGIEETAQYIRTRDITGGAVYTMTASTDAVWDGDLMFDSVDEGWDKVGEIEDIVLDQSGHFKGVVAEVGGFLDIGDKHVMLPIDNVKLVPIDDETYAIVTPYTLEELKGMENIDEGFWN